MFASCDAQKVNVPSETMPAEENISDSIGQKIVVGAERTDFYLEKIHNKKVGIVANHTSFIGDIHLVDSLLKRNVNIIRVFAPEHGFRGDHDAGAIIENGKDVSTGLEVFSLHGKHKKPTKESLNGIEVMLFDIQDVGVRFYTYISTLHYVMEACAENNIPLIVLDRPNPNAHYVDGPIMESCCTSFVGMHPVPVVYGMTIGEYAQMINGENWLKDSIECDLQVIPLENWNHDEEYILPIAPSPNLPNQRSIYLYPSLCFFEATTVSVGRGTEYPFQLFGHPDFPDTSFSFVPKSIPGKSTHPKQEGKECFGVDLTELSLKEIREKKRIDWSYFLQMDSAVPDGAFMERQSFFELLLGKKFIWESSSVKDFITLVDSKEEIVEFNIIRNKYLIY